VGADALTITATSDEIRAVIAGDAMLLRTLHTFFDAICGDLDADISILLDELPGAIAQCSPFASEADLSEVVRREMLAALHALTLRVLPARGTA
jgi:hypothetical protein